MFIWSTGKRIGRGQSKIIMAVHRNDYTGKSLLTIRVRSATDSGVATPTVSEMLIRFTPKRTALPSTSNRNGKSARVESSPTNVTSNPYLMAYSTFRLFVSIWPLKLTKSLLKVPLLSLPFPVVDEAFRFSATIPRHPRKHLQQIGPLHLHFDRDFCLWLYQRLF